MSNSCGDLPHALFRLFLYVCWFRPGKRLRECCACVRCRARVLAPHTILCPQVFRNFLEIVKYHRSLWTCVTCVAHAVCGEAGAAGHRVHLEPIIISTNAAVEGWLGAGARASQPMVVPEEEDHMCVFAQSAARVLWSARRVSRRYAVDCFVEEAGGAKKASV